MAYKNRADQARAAHEHYLRNKKKMGQRSRVFVVAARQRNAEFVYQFLLKNPCVDCGEANPLYLDPDHVRGKKRCNISDLVRAPSSVDTLQKELAKCDIRCVKCHRRRTAIQQNWWIVKRNKNI